MSDRPETLEETQARLARVEQGAEQQAAAPPSVSAPVPSVVGPPGSPYGPPVAGLPDPAELGGVGEFGTAPTRPDPYAASASTAAGLATSAFPPPAAPTVSRRTSSIIAIATAAVTLVVVGGVVAYNAFTMDSPDPYTEPEYSEEWQNFPGVSYSDPNETLAQPSYEQVVATTDELLTEYRDALTAEFGLVWTERYDSYTGLESNGYGGDSMLYYYDSGSWQGQAKVDDPGARQRIFDIFTELAAANGGDGVLLRNELYSDDPDYSISEFGAAAQNDQALWSFFDSFPSLAEGYLSIDVFDRTLPVDATFDGDYMFDFDESTDTLFVTVNGFSGALLKEGDREEFQKALEPYHGDYEP